MLEIVIDTREQQPWAFPSHLATVERGTLDVGDYALKNDTGFAIERKSLNDFIGTISNGWDRFLREIDRMKDYPAKIIIVEAGITEIINHEYNAPLLQPSFILMRISELIINGICVLFADNPITAAGMAWKILHEREKTKHEFN